MGKFKKLELTPLTNIKELNLDIIKNLELEVERNDDNDKNLKELLSFVKSNPDITKIATKVSNENYKNS
jgi:hypothetical protein